ncbi:hypothetical protein DFS34DRAFT_652194 [Phlyctochytrium arcticum]|nr:hypothetical protein DFS34DRAFT_652194 [Phlyctochytrium arcticum]
MPNRKDRLTKELQTQREWEDRWGCLVDPRLYSEHADPARWKKSPPKHHSPFSILNPPGKHALMDEEPSSVPAAFSQNNYKVTGDRSNFLAHTPRAGQPRPSANLQFAPAPTTPYKLRHEPAHHSAPFAVATPLKSQPSISGTNKNRGTLPMSHHRHYPRPNPQEMYKYPPTSNTEYGWGWGGQHTLEVYGSTSANFVKESWKRLSRKDLVDL